MKPEKIHDALNYIDDELIEAADKLRGAPRTVRIRYTHTLAAVAAVCVMLVATLIFARYVSNNLTGDGSNVDNSAGYNDTAGKGMDSKDGMSDSMTADPNDGAVAGVTIEKRVINESYEITKSNPAIDYFCHDGRIYVPYGEIVYRPYDEVIGEKLGTVTNVFEAEPHGDYYGELHGNMNFDVYKMKDYDESFMLAVDVDGSYYVFINDNGFTLKTGADILRDRLKLESGFSGVTMQYYQGEWQSTVQKHSYEIIERFITAMCDAPVISPDSADLGGSLCIAMLRFEHDSGTLFTLQLYSGGYVSVLLGKSAVLIQLDEDVFDSYTQQLGYTRFDPIGFTENISTPQIEEFAFYHKVFPTSTYLYLYTDAHYWPEDFEEIDIKYDRSSIKVYYYDPNFPKGIGTVTLSFPDNFDTTYDHVTPIYANGGGGSGECEIVFRLDYGDKKVYVAFNNFTWANSIFDFEYAGIVSEAYVKENLPIAQSKAFS